MGDEQAPRPEPSLQQGGALPSRRSYDSPVRRERAARTRDRIIAAGADLVREFASWDWRGVTMAAVAARAGVHERTVFRHFPNEQQLRLAVAERLEQAAGAVEGTPALVDLAGLVRRMFAYLASVPAASVPPRIDPAIAQVDTRRRESVAAAVAAAAPQLEPEQQRRAAAVLDVLSGVPTYQRLVGAWGLDPQEAGRSAAWAVDLVVAAVLAGAGLPPGSD